MEEAKRVSGQKVGGKKKKVNRGQVLPTLKVLVKGLYFLLCGKASGESDIISILQSPLASLWRMDRRDSSGSKETSEMLTAQNKQYTKTASPEFLQERGDTAGDPYCCFSQKHSSVST